MRRTTAAALLGIVCFAFACAVPEAGIFTRKVGSDIPIYRHAGEAFLDGTLPYRDYYLEYPPGALPVFVAPTVGPAADYVAWFKALMALCGAAAVALVAVVLAGASTVRLFGATAFAGLAPLVLGPTVLNRFDLWPAMLLVGALAALAHRRWLLGFGVLGAAIAAKGFALFVLPVALALVWRREGRRQALRDLGVCAAVVGVFTLPFLALGPGGLRYTLWVQLKRPLQVESLGASLLEAAHHLGLYEASVVSTYGSQNLEGGVANAVAAATAAVLVLALVATWLLYRRGRLELLPAAAASVAAFVAFGKVLSPQFLIWLIPLAAVVARLLPAALLVAALALTRAWFPGGYGDVVAVQGETWLVLARDLLLVALFVALVGTAITSRARPGASERSARAP